MTWWTNDEFRNCAQAICRISGLSPGQYHYGQVALTDRLYNAYGHKQRDKSLEILALVGFWPMRWTIQLSQSSSVVFDFYPSQDAFSTGYETLDKERILKYLDDNPALSKTRKALSEIDFFISLLNLACVYTTVWDNRKRLTSDRIYTGKGRQSTTMYNHILSGGAILFPDGGLINVTRYPDGQVLPLGQAGLEQAVDDLLNNTGKTELIDIYRIENNVQILKELLRREETALKVYRQLEERRKKT